MRLDGKVALITGGETGIGLATARRFAAEGAALHLVGIDEDARAAAESSLGALVSVADVTSEDAVAAGVERYGRYDVLFSNAGISGHIGPITSFPSEEFARVLRQPCSTSPPTRARWSRRILSQSTAG